MSEADSQLDAIEEEIKEIFQDFEGELETLEKGVSEEGEVSQGEENPKVTEN